ncbi:cell wall protein DAN4-like isoform X2 [Rosa rugosa]|uniref:cell wall protein DAN4-like isoform X2 n=1 Tax=Rosa rugosa TaxID=74645 RepID=UPI002B411BF9|nr:cell wall protein DAN4-like isoform X2 [Rosa rugosa]
MKNDASTWLKKKDEISSQISAQIFDFCDPELFQETLQNSEVTSSSNCCYDENSSYATNLSLPQDLETKFSTYQDNNGNTDTTIAPTPTTTSTTTTTTTSSTNTTTASTNTTNINATTATTNNNNSGNLSIIFDSQEEIDNDISASIDFSPSPPFSVPPFLMTQQDQFDFTSVPTQISLADSVVEGFSQYPADPVPPLMSAPLSSVFEEDCLSSVPSYVPLNPSSPSCSFLGPTMGAYMPAGTMNAAALSADSTGIFTSSILMASELQPQDLEYQGDNGGIFCPESFPRGFNPEDLQMLGAESQQLVSGAGNSTSLPTEIPMAEDPNFKVGKLSVEERKEKIHRYMKKRNERNFTKKIKYACRKTLADSRPRVRGRFAKNDDFGENHRPSGSNHEDDEDDEVVVKEEEDMVDSSDIFAHISGVNSFKCSYPIQSWI